MNKTTKKSRLLSLPSHVSFG